MLKQRIALIVMAHPTLGRFKGMFLRSSQHIGKVATVV